MATAEELIKQRISELPPYVKQAIGEAQATTKLRDIGLKHKLRIDQQTVMEREVMLVMLGFDTESTFVRNLVAEAKIPLPEAQLLAQEIGEGIFAHIRAAMRRMTEEKQVPTEKKPDAPYQAPVPAAKPPAPRSVVPPSAAAVPPKAPPPLAPAAPTVQPAPAPSVTPSPVPSAPAAPQVTAAPLEGVSQALSSTQSAPGTVVHVGLSPQKPGYKLDPYREEIE